MRSNEEDNCEICELEKLSVLELLKLAKNLNINYDESKNKVIEDYQIIDDLMASGKIAELRKELSK